jgi:hypothetical protein
LYLILFETSYLRIQNIVTTAAARLQARTCTADFNSCRGIPLAIGCLAMIAVGLSMYKSNYYGTDYESEQISGPNPQ